MAVNGQVVATSPADDLLERLDDPKVAAALKDLLDHADLLAVLVTGLDGFVSRGDVIANSLADAASELRGARGAGAAPWEGVDLAGLAQSIATLSGPVVGATPALQTLLTSSLTDPRTVGVISHLAQSLADGHDAVEKAPDEYPTGVFSLLRALRDEDVARGLAYFLQVAKAFGRHLHAD